MNNERLANRLLLEFEDQFQSDSEDDSNVNIENKLPVNVIRIRGFRSGSDIIWAPDERFLYYQNSFNKVSKETACTCYVKECDARIFIKEDKTAYKLLHTEHKDHGSMYEIFKHMKCFNQMKDRCLTAPASMSVRDIYNEVVIQ